jgi:hypothetical protein
MDYSALAATSVRQIRDKGRTVSFIYETQGDYSAEDDEITGNSSDPQNVKMLITNYNQKDIDGTIIQHGDKLGLLAPDNLERVPATGDRVVDGETYTVKNVLEIKPGDTALLYKLQLRK